MFPLGSGFVRLALYGWMPLLPSWAYLVLELAAFVACVVWYARSGWRRPELGFVLAVFPLFFAWRSLSTYFYFVALPAFALMLARKHDAASPAPAAAAEPAAMSPAVALVAGRIARGLELARGLAVGRR
jgi:hypothetical protein